MKSIIKNKNLLSIILMIALALFVVFFFTACSLEPNDSNSDGDTTTPQSVTFVVDEDNSEENINVVVGENKKVSAPIITKDGYTLVGWYTNRELTNQFNFDLEVTTDNLVLHAKWEAKIYTIVYYVDGNITDLGMSQYTIETTNKTLPAPEKKGYIFRGWYTNSAYNGEPITQVDTSNLVNLVLHAKWEIKVYTIVYYVDGNITDLNMSQYTIETTNKTLPAPEKEGYIFRGWYTNQRYNGETIKQVDTDNLVNLILFGYYEKLLTVTFVDTNMVELHAINNVEKGSIISSYQVDGRNGYTYDWYNGTTKFNFSTGITQNLTLQLVWRPIVYNLFAFGIIQRADGTFSGNDKFSARCNLTSEYTIESPTIVLNAPMNETGCIFEGWYTDTDLTQLITEIPTGSYGNKTIFAKYSLQQYSIVYMVDGVENEELLPNSYNIKQQFELPTISKNNYVFKGWYKNQNFIGSQVSTIAYGTTGDFVLYAKFVELLTVTFDTTGAVETIEPIKVEKGQTINAPLTLTIQPGYKFISWLYNGTPWNFYSDTVQNNMELVINIAPIGYNINYHIYGTSNNANNPYTYNTESSDIVLQPLSKTTNEFEGWYTDGLCKNRITKISAGSYGDIDVYAKFVPIEISTKEQLQSINLKADYILTNDIDLNGLANWVPIGSTAAFEGTFDGNGHKIYKTEAYAGDRFTVSGTKAGLFGNNKGKIINLQYMPCINLSRYSNKLGNVNATVGGLVAVMDDGLIENCMVCYTDNQEGILEYFVGNDDSTLYAGGLVGSMQGGVVKNCRASTFKINEENATTAYLGGLIGKLSGGYVVDCFATTSIDAKKSTTLYAGGLIGAIIGNMASVKNCFSVYSISSTIYETLNPKIYYGGLIGSGVASTISNCKYCNNKQTFFCFDENDVQHNYDSYTAKYRIENIVGIQETSAAQAVTVATSCWDENIWYFESGYYPRLKIFMTE